MDIALFFLQGNTFADIGITPPDLTTNKDLQSAVIISLFCNRLAEEGDPIDGNDRQGWWGDTYNGHLIGSRLWELRRAKQLQSVVNLARQYCLEALQWLIEDQIATSVEVQTEIIAMYTLGIGVQIYQPTGIQTFKFSYVWSQI